MMEQTEQISQDHIFRLSFKQSAKGLWQGEFTVRADTEDELIKVLQIARLQVDQQLLELNNPGGHENENEIHANVSQYDDEANS